MSKDFYRQFEERHRGSRELILSRLQIYLPFITPLQQSHDAPLAIDLGCGRGEWLELVTQAGFLATGVDLDEQMLSSCHERGLKVQCQDAISALKKLPSDSQMLVSGFHLAEHLLFSDLQELVKEAFRVLKTGGLLILETPNPENIVVGSSNFYLDPSHHHPLPPLLLSFLPEFYGFDRVKVLRLQEPLDLSQSRTLTIHDVLGGVSPDYAVIAQKYSSKVSADLLAPAFNAQYGISLGDVAKHYEEQSLEQRLLLSFEISKQAAKQAELLEIKESQILGLSARLNTVEKILTPLLWANQQRRLLRQEGLIGRLKSALKKVLRKLVATLNRLVDHFPGLRGALIKLLQKIGIYQWAYRILKPILNSSPVPNASSSILADELDVNKVLATLPPQTQKLYKHISNSLDKEVSK